jgi:GNAT superfamily N-acetyltransferase
VSADVRLRDGRPEEVGALTELQRRAAMVWEEDRAILEAHPEAVAVPLDAVRERRVRVAAAPDDTPLGFALVLPVTAGECELDALFVEPGLHGRGLGRRLLEDVAARVRAAGARELFVVSGPGAVGFYERAGFRPIGEVPTAFGPAHQLARAL